MLPQQSFIFCSFSNLFLYGWKGSSKVCSGSIFSFCMLPPVQPSVQISNAEMLIRASPSPTFLAFSKMSYKLWIKRSDRMHYLVPDLRRNIDMMVLRFAPLVIWSSEAPKTVSEWERWVQCRCVTQQTAQNSLFGRNKVFHGHISNLAGLMGLSL